MKTEVICSNTDQPQTYKGSEHRRIHIEWLHVNKGARVDKMK